MCGAPQPTLVVVRWARHYMVQHVWLMNLVHGLRELLYDPRDDDVPHDVVCDDGRLHWVQQGQLQRLQQALAELQARVRQVA